MLARTLSFFYLFLLPLSLFADGLTMFRTPDWSTVTPKDYRSTASPMELSPQVKTTVTPECVILDSTALKDSDSFRQIQFNVGEIDPKAIGNQTYFFTFEVEGPAGSLMSAYLEGTGDDGKFTAVWLFKDKKPVLNGRRQNIYRTVTIPDGIRSLHWRFDFFQPGVYKIYGAKAEAVSPVKSSELDRKAELTFYAPFDGTADATFAAGVKTPLEARNPTFIEGIRGQAAEFTSGNKAFLRYALEKNLDPERGSISLWLKRNPSDAGWRTMLSMPWVQSTRIGSGAIWFWIWEGHLRADTSDTRDQCLMTNLPDVNGWVHLVFTWNAYEKKLYVNGRCVVGERPISQRLEPFVPEMFRRLPADSFMVGSFQYGNPVEGALDELKIFSAPLTAEEVTALYRAERSLELSASSLYYFNDSPAQIRGTVENVGPQAAPVELYLRDSEGKEVAPTLKLTAKPAPKPGVSAKTPFEFPARKLPSGTYSVEVRSAGNPDPEGDVTLYVFDAEKFRPTAPGELKLKLVEDVPIFKLGPDRLATSGNTTLGTGKLNGREYLEIGPNYENRFAVKLPALKPDVLYCFEIDFPDDAQRTVDIIAQDSLEPNNRRYEYHGGYLTGDEYPCTNRFITQRILYRAATADNSLLFMTARKSEKGAALAGLRVYEVEGRLPSAVVHEAQPVNQWTRTVGLYSEDTAFGYCFGKSFGTPDEFETSVSRLCDYMRYTGRNALTYPIIFYHGKKDLRQHIPDYFGAFLTIFDHEGFGFMASVNQYHVPFHTPPVTDENLHSGELNDSVFMIHADGLPNRVHPYCLFHPEARAMMDAYVDEMIAEGKSHPSFKGISFHLVFNNLLTFGDLSMGYNDFLIEAFERETGIQIPVDHKAPNRGKLYADWLLENERERWIDWRCKTLADYYIGVAKKLADARPDLRLVLNCKVAIAYQKNFGLPHEFDGLRDYWERANREMGIDAKYFRDFPNIILEQTIFPADYRWMTGIHDEAVRDTLRLTETRPGQYGTIRNANTPWINHHDRYWESYVGDPQRNTVMRNHFHTDWLKEHTWRVSTLNPTEFYAMRHFVMPLRYCDVQGFNKGGFIPGTLGMEPVLTPFAQAFRALPAVRFTDVPGSTDEVKIRSYSNGERTWFYAVNTSEKEVVIRFPVKEEGELIELVPNAEISVAAGTFEVKLKPYELKSFCWLDSREVEVKSVSVIGN
ncbi:MAG: LamG domain-containing protein [Thermoguttaceae bacterium]|nr:LamG domain-containing protein [Thermoguttaceae bacterium]